MRAQKPIDQGFINIKTKNLSLPHLSHSLKSRLKNRPEYIIYAYETYVVEDLGKNHWQLVLTTLDSDKACRHAEVLFTSKQYQKIEVKKKIFDEKKGRYVATTFKNFESSNKTNYLTLGAIFVLALSSLGLFAFSVL